MPINALYTKRRNLYIGAVATLLLLPAIDAPTVHFEHLFSYKNSCVFIDFILHLYCVLFGFLNYHKLVPKWYFRECTISYWLLVALAFGILCFFSYALFFISPLAKDHNVTTIHFLFSRQITHLFYLFMGILLFTLLNRNEEIRRIALAEKSESEMRYLKLQINPHFFFNSLNSIYSLILVNPERAGDYLLKVSNLMRAILTSSNVSKMPLNDALDRLQDYFDLQKMRFSDSVEFNYQNSITPNNYEIGSMLIVPFVENAFKYGIHPHKKSMISVNIDLQKNVLLIKIENTDHSLYSTETSKQNKLGTQSTKIGIENVRLRLNLYYPSSHKLNIYKHNGLFIVELSITFEDNK